jgi:hypothetical protein
MKSWNASTHKLANLAAACALAVSAAGTHCDSAIAQQQSLAATDLLRGADLERAFWVCDYVATVRGVGATPLEICAAVYEVLKGIKFHGDFDQLLLWWTENKLSEHQTIAREGRGDVSELLHPR